MARLPRLVVAGQPHVVVQNGRPGQPVFVDDRDRVAYVDALMGAARASGVAVHAFALAGDRVLLLATPHEVAALGRFMQRLGRRYVASFHERHGTAGSLWAGRFLAAPIEPEHYLLPAIRYVEQAPVRAGLAARAGDWPWSSAQHHIGKKANARLVAHPTHWRLGNTPFEREAKHESTLEQPLSDAEVVEFDSALRGGWVLGGRPFIAEVGKTTERLPRPRPLGRPRTSR